MKYIRSVNIMKFSLVLKLQYEFFLKIYLFKLKDNYSIVMEYEFLRSNVVWEIRQL